MANIGKILKVGSAVLAAAGGLAGTVEVVSTVVESHTVEQVHEIITTDKYTIDGIEVSKTEWQSYLNSDHTVETYTLPAAQARAVEINSRSFDTDGIARLADFIDFEFYNGQCYAAKIISDKVVGVEYDYSYIQDGIDHFAETGKNLIYQDTTSGVYGMTFTVGSPTEEYDILTKINASMFNTTTLTDYYIFYFDDSNTNTRPLQFYEVFDSIKLTIAR